ncbi:conjugal transfer protein TraF [Aliidiomarina celeris]|uniref:conjugal transfer protein TraF n=1 Tax=Aliidiomarina celeris TaxID=2249428 RepID=UPI000DEAF005|nr:conjugal transfer protein TraF [Aliidiomarina celeris]
MTRLQWVVFIGLGVCSLVATVAYAETRTQAMAGAGVSNGTPLQAGYLNPALMITNERAVVFPSFTFEGADPHGVVGRVTEFQRDYKQLETLFSESDLEEIQQAREQLASSFERIKGSLHFNASFYALASFPLEQLSAGLYVRVEPRLFTGTKLAEADHTLIENARSPNDLIDLRSSALVVGATQSELGAVFGKRFESEQGIWSVGVSSKVQRLDAYAYADTIENFDDTQFDAAQYSTHKSVANVDLGFTYTRGPWSLGVVGRNLLEHELASVPFFVAETLHPIDYRFEPEYVLGVGWRSRGWLVSADTDLNAQNYLRMAPWSQRLLFGDVYQHQFVRLGAEWQKSPNVQLRFGIRHDLKALYTDTLSAGAGLTLYPNIHLNWSATYNRNDRFGGGFQFVYGF